MIIFSLPRAFDGYFGPIQRNAIMSWKLTSKETEIALFGDEEGTKEICQQLNLRHIPEVKTNHYGTPYLPDLFGKAQEILDSSVFCYLNCDMILLGGLETVVSLIYKSFPQFLLVARRWDLDIDREELDFSGDWKQVVITKLRNHGELRHSGASDCFFFTKGLYPRDGIPPFLFARYFWDGWLIYEALRKRVPTVDITDLTVIHQSHIRCNEGLYDAQQWAGESLWNRMVLNGRKARVTQSSHILAGDTIKERTPDMLVKLRFTSTPKHRFFKSHKLRLSHGQIAEVDRTRADKLLKNFKENFQEVYEPNLSWKDKP